MQGDGRRIARGGLQELVEHPDVRDFGGEGLLGGEQEGVGGFDFALVDVLGNR